MEKFSTWRDASNGIAPYVLPVPTGDDIPGILLLAARLLQSIFAVIRFLLFIIFVGTFLLLDSLLSLLLVSVRFPFSMILAKNSQLKHALQQPWPSISHTTSIVSASILLRPCLAICFGYFYITEEQAATRRRATSARNAKPIAGDLVISNWSSFIDILYLQYK